MNNIIFKYSKYFNIINLLINLTFCLFVIYNSEINIILVSLLYLSSSFLIFFSFNNNTIFFEKFLTLFIWLGYPFKLAIPYIALSFGYEITPFPENSFLSDYSKNIYDNAIIFSIFGILGFLLAIFIRKKFIFFYPTDNKIIDSNLKFFYEKYKFKILIIYFITVIFVNFFNLYFEIYQKGISSSFKPSFIVYLFKWLLLMGFTSFACYFVYFELINKKNYKSIFFIFLTESFLSNVSILSRSFIFNVGISLLLLLDEIKKNIKINFLTIVYILFFGIILFILNISLTTNLRNCLYNYDFDNDKKKIFLSSNCLNKTQSIYKNTISNTSNKISSLSFARWVGMDSMIAVMNKKELLNLNLYYFFLGEKKVLNKDSLYEEIFLNHRNNIEGANINKIILPGFISYQAISGSKFFVFFSCFILGLVGAFLEKFSYRFSYNNFVLSAFISYTFVFRIVHFGYLPLNTLLYFFIIIFTFLQFRIYESILDILNKNKITL